jgi:hypothetical protein
MLEMREKLGSGVRVLVYPHLGGAPTYATLSLRHPFTSLTLTKETRQKVTVVIDDISEIRPHTENAYAFTCMNIPKNCEGRDYLFTIIASEKSISMAADSPEMCIFLVKGLKLILEYAIPPNIKKLRGKEAFCEQRLLKIVKYLPSEKDKEYSDRVLFKLNQGIDVLYVKGNGKYKERIMTLDRSDRRILFLHRREDDMAVKLSVVDSVLGYFEGPPLGMDLLDISEIRPGYTSAEFAKFEPPPPPSMEHLAYTLVSSERSVAVLMRNEMDMAFISTDFQLWLHVLRISSTIY